MFTNTGYSSCSGLTGPILCRTAAKKRFSRRKQQKELLGAVCGRCWWCVPSPRKFFSAFCCLCRSFLVVSRSPLSIRNLVNFRPAQCNALYLKLTLKLHARFKQSSRIFFFYLSVVSHLPCLHQEKPLFLLQVHGERPCGFSRSHVLKGQACASAESCAFSTDTRASKDRHVTSRGTDK